MRGKGWMRGVLGAAAVACVVGVAAPSPARAGDEVRAQAAAVLDQFSGEPSVLEVQRVAARYAHMHPEAYENWMAAASWAHLLPDKLEGWLQSWNRNDKDVRTTGSTGSISELLANEDRLRLRLVASWDLSKIVFNTTKIQASKEIVRVAGQREDLLTTVNKLYFARRELQAELVINPPADVKRAIRLELRLRALTADLDALTGGWFSEQLGQPSGTPAAGPALP